MSYITPLQALWSSVIITAIYPVVGKLAVGSVSPLAIVLLGTLGTALIYVPWLFKKGYWRLLFRRDLFFKFAAVGLFGTALPYLLIFIALNYTTPANSAILNQTEVIYSLILSAVFLKEYPSKKQLFGTAVLICGVGLLLAGEGLSVKLKGDLIILATVWMFQVSHIAAKKLPADIPDNLIVCARALFGFLCTVPTAFILTRFDVPFYCGFSLKSVLILLFMAVFNNLIGNIFWYKAIRNMALAKATAVILVYPVFTYLLSAALGYDKLKMTQILGLLLAMGGAYMVTNTIRKGTEK